MKKFKQEGSIQMAESLNNMASVYQIEGQLSEALKMFQQCL